MKAHRRTKKLGRTIAGHLLIKIGDKDQLNRYGADGGKEPTEVYHIVERALPPYFPLWDGDLVDSLYSWDFDHRRVPSFRSNHAEKKSRCYFRLSSRELWAFDLSGMTIDNFEIALSFNW